MGPRQRPHRPLRAAKILKPPALPGDIYSGQLPYDLDHEMQFRQEGEARLPEEARFREWQLQNRNDLLASAAEQQERVTNFLPNVLGGIGRTTLSAPRTAAEATAAAEIIAKADGDRKNR